MTTAELKEKGAICFARITEGLNKYADVKLVMDEKKALAHFKTLKKEYGAENAYADFYYYRLDSDAREMLFSTIYFVQSDPAGRARTSWWGNYEKEYICFRDRQDT